MRRPEIRDLGILMKQFSDSVAHEIPHDGKSVLLRINLNAMGDIGEAIPGFGLFYPEV
jgi:hypothetical protein